MINLTERRHRRLKLQLTVRGVVGDALALYRMEPGRIALIALVTFIPIDIVTILLGTLSDRLLSIGHIGLSAGTGFLIFFLLSGGQVFLAGVIDHVAGATVDNKPAPPLAHMFSRLPLGRLIGADLLVSFASALAGLVLILPGIIVFAFFGIVGPVINIEDRGIVDALKRSASLVRPHVWLACELIVIPWIIEYFVVLWFHTLAHGVSFLWVLLISAVLSVTLRALVGLLEVVMGHALIRGTRPGS